ncbi:hypothetical protein GKZ68_06595 [Hymenobacter sp. BRD128]|uniref:hypothetical protein n=1 Tax=Hymenobacter sp. BRD128 TaxID=2675878 RepID=UPI001563DE67|nr:hypothetical protein [Hymenobacter sp. BRD128]QKG56334.1 hypothetical protein GKZ68_06595 [Hymenobacter sp. BRD128]
MSTKLKKLLAAYEAERASLTTEMEECVAEMDYGKARLFFKTLARVNQQLQTLYNLQDSGHDEKEQLRHSIKFLEEKIIGEKEYMRRYLAERLAEEKEQLAKFTLAAVSKQTTGYSVRNVLGKVLAGEITSFILVLQDSQRLNCYIRLVRKTLMLTIPEVRRHKQECTLEKRQIKAFMRLGFKLCDDKDKLMLFAPYSTLEDVQALQHKLARITFDIFYFKDLAGETFIKYYP